MAEKEIIVFGVDFNKNPSKEDALAIVHVEEALPLAVIHPKEVVPVPPKKTVLLCPSLLAYAPGATRASTPEGCTEGTNGCCAKEHQAATSMTQ
jgi:hypothetical protein